MDIDCVETECGKCSEATSFLLRLYCFIASVTAPALSLHFLIIPSSSLHFCQFGCCNYSGVSGMPPDVFFL